MNVLFLYSIRLLAYSILHSDCGIFSVNDFSTHNSFITCHPFEYTPSIFDCPLGYAGFDSLNLHTSFHNPSSYRSSNQKEKHDDEYGSNNNEYVLMIHYSTPISLVVLVSSLSSRMVTSLGRNSAAFSLPFEVIYALYRTVATLSK